jgi:hypothetical protein
MTITILAMVGTIFVSSDMARASEDEAATEAEAENSGLLAAIATCARPTSDEDARRPPADEAPAAFAGCCCCC